MAACIFDRQKAAQYVDATDILLLLDRLLEQRRAGAGRGDFGEEDVKPAEFGDAARDDRLNVGFSGGVGHHPDCNTAFGTNQPHGFFGVFAPAPDDKDRGAFTGKTQRAGAADAATRASDDGLPPLQSFHAIASCNSYRGDRPAAVSDDGSALDVAALVASQENRDRRDLRSLAEATERHLGIAFGDRRVVKLSH